MNDWYDIEQSNLNGGDNMITIVNIIWVLIKTLGKFLMSVLMLLLLTIIGINLFVILSTQSAITSSNEVSQNVDVDTPILVLGAGVVNNEYPSQILANRLDMAYDIHTQNLSNPLIMSGDHADQYYNEVGVMKNYLVDKGIPSEQIYLDHAGYSTYASLYRLKDVIGEEQVIIVTQGYHLPRALMIAEELGINALGVPAQEVDTTRIERELREVFARIKDFSVLYLKYDGENPETGWSFTLQESGDLTNIKEELE